MARDLGTLVPSVRLANYATKRRRRRVHLLTFGRIVSATSQSRAVVSARGAARWRLHAYHHVYHSYENDHLDLITIETRSGRCPKEIKMTRAHQK